MEPWDTDLTSWAPTSVAEAGGKSGTSRKLGRNVVDSEFYSRPELPFLCNEARIVLCDGPYNKHPSQPIVSSRFHGPSLPPDFLPFYVCILFEQKGRIGEEEMIVELDSIWRPANRPANGLG